MKKYKVAIVDDDQSLSYSIKDHIEKDENFEVVGIAHDGLVGTELIKTRTPDIVILDMVMPKVDGLAILETFQHSNIDFIVLSAIGHDLVTRRAVSLGAVYYLVKPFELKSLMDRMHTLFLGNSLEEEVADNSQLYMTKITNELQSLGVPMHIKGYHYIKDAVKIIIAEDENNIKITKSVYPQIANQYETSPSSVERAIRSAVEVTFNRNREMVSEYFSKEIFNQKITNKEFLLRIANRVKRKM